MNIQQAVKMAWKSIWGKKGRSALTMLGIIIGIAAVMTIVSAINGYTEKTMEQYEAPSTSGTTCMTKMATAWVRSTFRRCTTTATASRSMCWA